MSIQRQPKGIPVGGQFAANSHDEAPSLTTDYQNLDRDVIARESIEALYAQLENNEVGQNYLEGQGIDTLVFAGNQIDPPEYADIEYDIQPELRDKITSDIDTLVSRVPAIADGWASGDEKLFSRTVVSMLTGDSDASDQFPDGDLAENVSALIESKEVGFDEFDLSVGKSTRYDILVNVSYVE